VNCVKNEIELILIRSIKALLKFQILQENIT
jgi:hypothetical protein